MCVSVCVSVCECVCVCTDHYSRAAGQTSSSSDPHTTPALMNQLDTAADHEWINARNYENIIEMSKKKRKKRKFKEKRGPCTFWSFVFDVIFGMKRWILYFFSLFQLMSKN